MPNRYEREIEEILRNLEQTGPKPGSGHNGGERLRRRTPSHSPRRSFRLSSLTFSTAEWLLLVTVIAALVAGGYEFIRGEPDILSRLLATVGVVCLSLVTCSHFLFQPRRAQSVQYGNVTITRLRRNPLSMLKTRWNLMMLKMRYRRKNEP